MRQRTFSGEEQALLDRIRAAIRELEPTAEIILFGSRARGDAMPDSDWDLLVLLDGVVDARRIAALDHRLYDLALETDTVLTSIVRSKQDWASPLFKVMPLHNRVAREGMAL